MRREWNGKLGKPFLGPCVRGKSTQFPELEKEVRLWFRLRNGA